MVTCVILIDSVDTLNVSLIRDDKLLVNYIGNLPISHFINDKIDCLKVIFKPTLCNSVPEDGYKLGLVSVNGINKDCVISYEDFNNLSSFCSKVKNIEIYNYLDVCKNLFKDKERVLVVDSWSKSLASVLYMEFGNIVDFRRIKYNKLPYVINKMSEKYGYFDIINANKFYDIITLKATISNLDKIDQSNKNRLSYMKHLAYCLETSGINVLEKEDTTLSWSNEDDNPSNSVKDYYTRKLDEEDFEVASDLNEDGFDEYSYEDDSDEGFDGDLAGAPSQEPEKKIGFFAKLFGKKPKKNNANNANRPRKNFNVRDDEELEEPSNLVKSRKNNRKTANSRFSSNALSSDEYDDEDDEDEYRFSQIAVGDHRSSRKTSGYNPNVRKYTGTDYAFYISFIVFVSCALIFGGLQFIYKEKVGVLSNSYSSAVKMKNQMQASVEISENPANSPTVKVSQLSNIALPSSYNIDNIDFDGSQYKMTVSVGPNDNIDSFSSYLPDGIVLSNITEKSSSENSKTYDIVLVSS